MILCDTAILPNVTAKADIAAQSAAYPRSGKRGLSNIVRACIFGHHYLGWKFIIGG